MEIQQDFRDLLELFNSNKVDYIIVELILLPQSVAYHGMRLLLVELSEDMEMLKFTISVVDSS
jgi:hypothetical protein